MKPVFDVQRSPDKVVWTDIAPNLPLNTTSYVDKAGLTPNASYFYIVRAFKNLTFSQFSDSATAVTFAEDPFAGRFQRLYISSVSMVYGVRNNPADTIYESQASLQFTFNQIYSFDKSVANGTSTVRGLAGDSTYYFHIRSVNRAGTTLAMERGLEHPRL